MKEPPWIDKIKIVKMFRLQRAIYGFKAIPIKMSMTFFSDLGGKKDAKLHMETQRKQSWRHHNTRLVGTLQSSYSQNSLVVNMKTNETEEKTQKLLHASTTNSFIFDKRAETWNKP